MKLSAIVLIKKDQEILEKTLKSLKFCSEVLTFKNDSIFDFSLERNRAMKKAKDEWLLFLDSDEIISDELQKEIQKAVHQNFISAYYLRRRDYFWGKELKWGEVKKARDVGIIRLIKKNSGRWIGRVHEVFKTKENIGILEGFINHYPHQTIKEFLDEVNFYSTLRARELHKIGKTGNIFEIIFYPFAKFIYTYFFKFGFLDGPAGFTYAFMMSFHSFLVRSKLFQYSLKHSP